MGSYHDQIIISFTNFTRWIQYRNPLDSDKLQFPDDFDWSFPIENDEVSKDDNDKSPLSTLN